MIENCAVNDCQQALLQAEIDHLRAANVELRKALTQIIDGHKGTTAYGLIAARKIASAVLAKTAKAGAAAQSDDHHAASTEDSHEQP